MAEWKHKTARKDADALGFTFNDTSLVYVHELAHLATSTHLGHF